jgi:hypothetical protein
LNKKTKILIKEDRKYCQLAKDMFGDLLYNPQTEQDKISAFMDWSFDRWCIWYQLPIRDEFRYSWDFDIVKYRDHLLKCAKVQDALQRQFGLQMGGELLHKFVYGIFRLNIKPKWIYFLVNTQNQIVYYTIGIELRRQTNFGVSRI